MRQEENAQRLRPAAARACLCRREPSRQNSLCPPPAETFEREKGGGPRAVVGEELAKREGKQRQRVCTC